MWFRPSKPENIKPIPWLSPEATAYMESLLSPDFEVIEHGAGGSTLWFAERVKSVTSFENDDDWYRIVRAQMPENVTLRSNDDRLIADHQFDLCLIDGEPIGDRALWIKIAQAVVFHGGWIVLDNANRPEYITERKELFESCELVKTFSSNNSSHHYLVTEFWRVR